jgi:hypothetical protein
MKLGGSQSQSGHRDKRKNPFACLYQGHGVLNLYKIGTGLEALYYKAAGQTLTTVLFVWQYANATHGKLYHM